MASANFPISAPVINPGLGTDFGGICGLAPNFGEVAGRTCLAQALARRLITPRGSLIYDPDYGLDLTDEVGDDVTEADVMQLGPQIVTEFRKDERVQDASVTLQFVGVNQVQQALAGTVTNPNPYPEGVIVVAATITDNVGPFAFTLSVTSVTVALLTVATGSAT